MIEPAIPVLPAPMAAATADDLSPAALAESTPSWDAAWLSTRRQDASMHIMVNGARLYFDVEGAGLVPDGPRMREKPTLLLLHGGPGFDHSM